MVATGYAELGGDEAPGGPRLGKPFTQAELKRAIERIAPAPA